MAEWLEARIAGLEGYYRHVSDRLTSIDRRFESVDHRFDGVDHRFDSVDRRFDTLERRIDGVERVMQEQFSAVRAEFRSDFRWVIGLVVASILAPIALHFVH